MKGASKANAMHAPVKPKPVETVADATVEGSSTWNPPVTVRMSSARTTTSEFSIAPIVVAAEAAWMNFERSCNEPRKGSTQDGCETN